MPAFKNTRKIHNDIEIGKEVKKIIVVDTSLRLLNNGHFSTKLLFKN